MFSQAKQLMWHREVVNDVFRQLSTDECPVPLPNLIFESMLLHAATHRFEPHTLLSTQPNVIVT